MIKNKRYHVFFFSEDMICYFFFERLGYMQHTKTLYIYIYIYIYRLCGIKTTRKLNRSCQTHP
jgi:hypothetical protein